MTAADVLRLLIILGAVVVGVLWVVVGRKTRRWLWPAIALGWLVPVAVFFIVRYVFDVPVLTLNLISLSLYLMGVSSLGGVALAKLRCVQVGQCG